MSEKNPSLQGQVALVTGGNTGIGAGIRRALAHAGADVVVHWFRDRPGAIRTAINKDRWDDPENNREVLARIPYGRWGEPDDVSPAVAWLCSDAADHVTGHTLFVDGGMTLYPGFLKRR